MIDSCKAVIETAKHDTTICRAYVLWGELVHLINPDTALHLFQKARETADRHLVDWKAGLADKPFTAIKRKYLLFLSDALNNIGYMNGEKGNIQKQSECYQQSLKIREAIGDEKAVAISLNNIGYIYNRQGDVQKALEYYHKSLKINEELGDKNGVAYSLNNIGRIYAHQDDVQKALEYYHKSLKIYQDMGDSPNKALAKAGKKGEATSLNNIGYIHELNKDAEKALEYYLKSLKIKEEIGNKKGVSASLNNIGRIYKRQGLFSLALEYYQRSLKIDEELGSKEGVAYLLSNIGDIYIVEAELDLAKEYAAKSLGLAQELGYPEIIREAARVSSNVYRNVGDFEQALEMYELQIQMGDSINNENTQKAAIRQQTKYEFEKAQLIKEQEEREAARVEAEIVSRRDNLQYSIILLGLLVLGSLVLGLGKLALPPSVAEGLIFFSFLIFFEFLLVLADPSIDRWSGGAPGIKLLYNAGIAALIFPAHAFFESKLKKRLVKAGN